MMKAARSHAKNSPLVAPTRVEVGRDFPGAWLAEAQAPKAPNKLWIPPQAPLEAHSLQIGGLRGLEALAKALSAFSFWRKALGITQQQLYDMG